MIKLLLKPYPKIEDIMFYF